VRLRQRAPRPIGSGRVGPTIGCRQPGARPEPASALNSSRSAVAGSTPVSRSTRKARTRRRFRVGDVGLGEQDVRVAGHAARHWVDRVEHLQPLLEVRDGPPGLRDRHAVAGHDDHQARVKGRRRRRRRCRSSGSSRRPSAWAGSSPGPDEHARDDQRHVVGRDARRGRRQARERVQGRIAACLAAFRGLLTLRAASGVSVGETGFEPATARPPAGGFWAYPVRLGALQRSQLRCLALGCAQFGPRIGPRPERDLLGTPTLSTTPCWDPCPWTPATPAWQGVRALAVSRRRGAGRLSRRARRGRGPRRR
jgi:hypothetical protein